jgi:hypothetical protein
VKKNPPARNIPQFHCEFHIRQYPFYLEGYWGFLIDKGLDAKNTSNP